MSMSHSTRILPPLYSSLPKLTRTQSKIFCGQCDHVEATMKCLECTEVYCSDCFAYIHLRGALKRHRGQPIAAKKLSPSPTRKGTLLTRTFAVGEPNEDKFSTISDQTSTLRPLINKKKKVKDPIPKMKTIERLPKLRKRETSPVKSLIITSNDKSMQINPKHFAVLINIHHSYNENERSKTVTPIPNEPSPTVIETPAVEPVVVNSGSLRTVLNRQTSAELQASLEGFIDPYPLDRYSPFNFTRFSQTSKDMDSRSSRNAGFFTDIVPLKTSASSRLTTETDGSMTIPINDESQSRSSSEAQPTIITPIPLHLLNEKVKSASSSRSTTPKKLTDEWLGFDSDDDGCSSRACQNRHDEEYFQQLYEEFHSKQNVSE